MRTSATSAIMELQTRLRLMRYYCTSVGHTTYAPLVSPIDPRFPVEDVLFQTSPFKDPSGNSASGKDYARNALLYLETCILPAPSRAPFHYRISLQAKDMEPTGSHSKRHLIRYLTRRLLPPLPCFLHDANLLSYLSVEVRIEFTTKLVFQSVSRGVLSIQTHFPKRTSRMTRTWSPPSGRKLTVMPLPSSRKTRKTSRPRSNSNISTGWGAPNGSPSACKAC